LISRNAVIYRNTTIHHGSPQKFLDDVAFFLSGLVFVLHGRSKVLPASYHSHCSTHWAFKKSWKIGNSPWELQDGLVSSAMGDVSVLTSIKIIECDYLFSMF
jgi:hypothetical protein